MLPTPSEAVEIDDEVLAHLAAGEPVLAAGGRVLLVANGGLAKKFGAAVSKMETKREHGGEPMADSGSGEVRPTAQQWAALVTRVVSLEALYDALQERVADLEDAAVPPAPG